MKRTLTPLAAASVLTLAAANPALAGGLSEPVAMPAPAPVMMPAPVMSRDWSGFYAGAQIGYGQVDSPAFGGEEEGATYGVHAGYLYDFGTLVLGGEIDYDGSNIEGADLELESVLRAKAIAGYDAGAFMPYLTAGVARATTTGANDLEDDGQFFGLGVSYQFNDSIRMGAEVLRHEFDDFDDTELDVDATTASFRVSFTF